MAVLRDLRKAQRIFDSFEFSEWNGDLVLVFLFSDSKLLLNYYPVPTFGALVDISSRATIPIILSPLLSLVLTEEIIVRLFC